MSFRQFLPGTELIDLHKNQKKISNKYYLEGFTDFSIPYSANGNNGKSISYSSCDGSTNKYGWCPPPSNQNSSLLWEKDAPTQLYTQMTNQVATQETNQAQYITQLKHNIYTTASLPSPPQNPYYGKTLILKDASGTVPIIPKVVPWGPWSECTKTCGGGTKTRICPSDILPGPAVVRCKPDGLGRITSCNTQKCPIHGGWTKLPICPAKCNKVFSQDRDCTLPLTQHGGVPCQGDYTQDCSGPVCCQWKPPVPYVRGPNAGWYSGAKATPATDTPLWKSSVGDETETGWTPTPGNLGMCNTHGVVVKLDKRAGSGRSSQYEENNQGNMCGPGTYQKQRTNNGWCGISGNWSVTGDTRGNPTCKAGAPGTTMAGDYDPFGTRDFSATGEPIVNCGGGVVTTQLKTVPCTYKLCPIDGGWTTWGSTWVKHAATIIQAPINASKPSTWMESSASSGTPSPGGAGTPPPAP